MDNARWRRLRCPFGRVQDGWAGGPCAGGVRGFYHAVTVPSRERWKEVVTICRRCAGGGDSASSCWAFAGAGGAPTAGRDMGRKGRCDGDRRQGLFQGPPSILRHLHAADKRIAIVIEISIEHSHRQAATQRAPPADEAPFTAVCLPSTRTN
jgi:hypothetical protein